MIKNKTKQNEKKSKKVPSEKHIIEVIAEHEQPITNLINLIADKFLKSSERETKFSFNMALLFVFIISMIVIVSALLTFYDKIDGAALTFLLGLIVGYMLTFIREAIYPPE